LNFLIFAALVSRKTIRLRLKARGVWFKGRDTFAEFSGRISPFLPKICKERYWKDTVKTYQAADRRTFLWHLDIKPPGKDSASPDGFYPV
jgi:hypothetical protein